MDLSLEIALGGIIAGIDEAGCGPLAGPVVAAAVILDVTCIPKGINDSKKLPPEKREALYAMITARHCWATGIADVSEIDIFNIYRATMLAMQRAVKALAQNPDHALVDGNRLPHLPCQAHPVIKGDTISLSIAAASIIAKVTRDRIMRELSKEFPFYGWERNAGYGTVMHLEALTRLGPTPHHRRSFEPVQAALKKSA